MRKLLVVLAFAAGAFFLSEAPASAHLPNNYATLACAGTMTAQQGTLIDAHPEAFVGNPPSLLVTCVSYYAPLARTCFWSAYLLPDGTPFGPLNGYHCGG